MQQTSFFVKALLVLTTAFPLVHGHGAIVGATGNLGGTGMALAIDQSTPRDGTRRRPFQQDTTIFEDDTNTGCGRTLQQGQINIPQAMQAMVQATGGQLPQVSAGGQVTMTLHQVNADGAGPYTCMIDMTGTGTNFQPLPVTQNVPGTRGRDRAGEQTDFPLVAQLPATMQCTGQMAGMTNICMVRCQNPARAGPFGGCVPIQQAAGNAPAPAPVNNAPAPVNNAPAPVNNAPAPVNNVPAPVNNAPAPVNNAPAPVSNLPANGNAGNNFVGNAKRSRIMARLVKELRAVDEADEETQIAREHGEK